MDVTQLLEFIKTVGVPTAALFFVLVRIERKMDDNTLAINHLADHINDMVKGQKPQ